MVERALLPGEYAILGLLALRPMHGYEMACFFDDEGLSDVLPVEQSTLYTYLRNLEARDLVTWAEERVGLRPPRKTYSLSPEGFEQVHEWLRRPVERMREVRLDFLLKLYFLDQLDRAALLQLIAEQVAFCEEYIGAIRSRPATTPFRALVARSKRTAAESTLAWLREYARELDDPLAVRP